jgi:hypothetical protein
VYVSSIIMSDSSLNPNAAVERGEKSVSHKIESGTRCMPLMPPCTLQLAQTAKLFAEPQKHPDANCGNPPRDVVSPNNY